MALSGDELIAYGFKKLIEELQELKGEITILRSEMSGLADDINKTAANTRETANVVQRIYGKLDKVEHNTFMAVDPLLKSANSLEKIQTNTFTTELNTIRISQVLNKESTDGSELEGL